MRENLSKHKKLKLEMDFQSKDEGGVWPMCAEVQEQRWH